ncbi:hypothetical protein [Paenibacillus sonchi]|uniref:hypothetical protein n=1 Tax=Paenibacillus sonchi TaxID=373687 RepID=UPI001E584E1D|nr:hypothetical protein [Paenibacillus sonchi]
MSAEAPTIDYTFPDTFIVAVHYFNEFMDGTIATPSHSMPAFPSPTGGYPTFPPTPTAIFLRLFR